MQSGFLRIMTPILQRLVAFTIRILLGFALLSKVSFVIAYYLSHMLKVFLVVLGRILLWILTQNRNNLATAIVRNQSSRQLCSQNKNSNHLSCPTVSPEPSPLSQPEDSLCSSFNQSSNSEAVILTSSLNSLRHIRAGNAAFKILSQHTQ